MLCLLKRFYETLLIYCCTLNLSGYSKNSFVFYLHFLSSFLFSQYLSILYLDVYRKMNINIWLANWYLTKTFQNLFRYLISFVLHLVENKFTEIKGVSFVLRKYYFCIVFCENGACLTRSLFSSKRTFLKYFSHHFPHSIWAVFQFRWLFNLNWHFIKRNF